MTIDLSKRDSKDATIKISLKADSGYSATRSGRISPKQWGAICAITADKPTEAEKQRDELLLAAEAARQALLHLGGALHAERLADVIAKVKGGAA